MRAPFRAAASNFRWLNTKTLHSCYGGWHFVESASVVLRGMFGRGRWRVFLAERYCSRKNEDYEV